MDTEELEKELDSLLQDSTKEPVDLPPVPQKVLNPPISDAELEAELEKLSVSDGGTGGSKSSSVAAGGISASLVIGKMSGRTEV